MTGLERRYRGLLRVLPAWYRRAWEDDMVATFLAGMQYDDPEEAEFQAEYGRPSWAEVASVLLLAVRVRLPGLGVVAGGRDTSHRAVVWGEALRLVALVGVTTYTASYLSSLGIDLWLTGRVPWLPLPRADLVQAAAATQHTLWHQVWTLSAVAWPATWIALLAGYRRPAQILAVVALAPGVLDLLAHLAAPDATSMACSVGLVAVTVLALTAFHRDAPAPPRRPWLVALPVAFAGIAAFTSVAAAMTVWHPLEFDWYVLTGAVAFVAGVLHLAVPALRRDARAPYRRHALAVIIVLLFAGRVITLLDAAAFSRPLDGFSLLVFGVVPALALLAVGAPLVVLSARELREPAPRLVKAGEVKAGKVHG